MILKYSPTPRVCLSGLALACALLAPARASAGSADAARAEKLFQDALYLMDGGHVVPACLKLAESQRLVPASGTLLALADCHAKEGKTATAWGEFTELAQLSSAPQFVAEAKRRADELFPNLSYVSVRVTDAVEGLDIRFDDSPLGAGALDTDLPTDPGEHVVRASAPNYESISIRVTVTSVPTRKVVTIPPLLERAAPAPELVPVPAPHPRSDTAASSPSSAGYWIGGTGLALVALGSVFGVLSLSQNGDMQDAGCFGAPDPSFDCAAAQSSRDVYGGIATGGIVVGIAGAVIGGWMVLSGEPDDTALGSNSSRPPTWHVGIRPVVESSPRGVSGAGASIQGAF